MAHFFRKLANLLFPPACSYCGKYLIEPGDLVIPNLCGSCGGEIETFNSLFDGLTRKRLDDHFSPGAGKDSYILGAIGPYEDVILKHLIWSLKFKKKRSAGKTLAFILAKYLQEIHFDYGDYIIIPIPLHWGRKRKRGFNQTEVIAKELSALLQIPYMVGCLRRVRSTVPQNKLQDFKERKRNLEDAFRVKDPNFIRGKKIIIVDDVITSGATVLSAIEELRKGGATRAIALTAALAGK